MESLLGWAQNTEAENARRHSAEGAQLQNALAGATTQEEKNTILQNARTKNPGMIERMVARLKGNPAPAPFTGPAPVAATSEDGAPQTVLGPAPKLKSRDEATAQWAARGVAPEQQKADFARKQLAPDYQAEVAALKSVMPDASDQEIGAALGIRQPTIPWKNYVSPDGKQRQSFQAGQEPEGWQIAPTGQPRTFTVKTKEGALSPATVVGGQYVDPQGQVLEGAVPYVKPAPPPPTLAEVARLQAKKIMADKGKGPALTDEEEAQLQGSVYAETVGPTARAVEQQKAAAEYNVTPVYDPETGSEILPTRMQAVKAAHTNSPMRPGVLGSPTGYDKKTQTLALSSIQQVDRIENLLAQNPGMTGPITGQLNQLKVFVGMQDPEVQAMIMSGLLASEHGVAVFGGRNIKTIDDLFENMAALKTNPAALKASLDVVKETMQTFTRAGGRLPAPKNATPPKQGEKKKWSKIKWAAANQGKDVNAAAAQAAAQGREVID